MDFVRIGAAEHELGWRFTDSLPDRARAAIEGFSPMDDFLARVSRPRRVHLAEFEIAASPALTVRELLGDVYELELYTLEEVCDACDAALRERGWRVPTEDELEAAFGGRLFPWGDAVPDGEPRGDRTTFERHREPTAKGLRVDADTYAVELTRTALKLGDGGEAICGSYPWPIAWLSFCPSFRLAGDSVEELLLEFLETTRVRPVTR